MFDVVSNYKQNRPRLLAFYIAIAHETTYLCRFSNYGHQLFVISIRTKNNNIIMHSNNHYWKCNNINAWENQSELFLYTMKGRNKNLEHLPNHISTHWGNGENLQSNGENLPMKSSLIFLFNFKDGFKENEFILWWWKLKI